MAEHLDYLVSFRVEWISSLDATAQAALAAERTKMATEEGKAEAQAEMAATFGMADTNNDGFLDHAEFATFMGYYQSNNEARGIPPMNLQTEGFLEKMYAFFNSETPDDGISKEDIVGAFRKISAGVKARMAQ